MSVALLVLCICLCLSVSLSVSVSLIRRGRGMQAVRRHLKWRYTTVTPNVVKSLIERSGFRKTRFKGWVGTWGKHIKVGPWQIGAGGGCQDDINCPRVY